MRGADKYLARESLKLAILNGTTDFTWLSRIMGTSMGGVRQSQIEVEGCK